MPQTCKEQDTFVSRLLSHSVKNITTQQNLTAKDTHSSRQLLRVPSKLQRTHLLEVRNLIRP